MRSLALALVIAAGSLIAIGGLIAGLGWLSLGIYVASIIVGVLLLAHGTREDDDPRPGYVHRRP